MSTIHIVKLQNVLPFWLSLAMIPILIFAATNGGWTLVLPAFSAWTVFIILDALMGLETGNADPETPEDQLFWYRAITTIWFPIQTLTILGLVWYVGATNHLTTFEKIALFFGVGVMSGTVGINYSHELLHQKNKVERWLADLLLASVLYSHFRSEHLLVHHRYVGTPRDTVTARYNEGFHKYFPRVLIHGFISAFSAEREQLARRDLPWWDANNPFWRYWALQGMFLLFAMILGGWAGIGLFVYQAFIAVWQLELVNYIEHYGLTRKHLGDGKYERVQPRHSWNATHKASNWLLINLQRHSDHHTKPDRRFPLLQTYSEADAPSLPYGYPFLSAIAMCPPVFRRVMNPRVKKWRAMYYPEITDWNPYKTATNPQPH